VSIEVIVVLPTYNEAETLPRMIEVLMTQPYRVLVVDDGSPDGTGEIADRLAARHDRIAVLHRQSKEGLGPAYVAGFARALDDGAAIVCEMDADFSHDPADLPRLVAAIESGADVAIGSRYVPGGGTEGWPVHRRAISRCGNWYARRALGLPLKDVTAGFRAFSSDAIRSLEPATCEAAGYGFQVEMAARAVRSGLMVVEVPIIFRDRTAGESKMSLGIALEAMILVTRWGIRRLFRQERS
jgi:dolichol-phosphate mannosyltransferase